MNSKIILHNLGHLAIILGCLMLLPGMVSIIYREPAGAFSFSLAAILAAAFGLVMKRLGVGEEMGHK